MSVLHIKGAVPKLKNVVFFLHFDGPLLKKFGIKSYEKLPLDAICVYIAKKCNKKLQGE